MKKFHYRLEPILKIKSHIEKQRQKDHAHALQNVFRQQDVLAEIDNERNRTIDQQREKLTGKITVQYYLASSRFLGKLKKDTFMGKEVLAGLEKEAERKREALVFASKEKKIHEKLKEKKKAHFFEKIEMAENKMLDEIATQSFCFKHKR